MKTRFTESSGEEWAPRFIVGPHVFLSAALTLLAAYPVGSMLMVDNETWTSFERCVLVGWTLVFVLGFSAFTAWFRELRKLREIKKRQKG
jgi:hypothetical protein